MPSHRHTVKLSSGRIEAIVYPGHRTSVVLLHGNSACKEIFRHQISALCDEGFGVLALDLPGHGASDNADFPSETYSFPGYAKIVAELLDAFTVSRAHVVGWSLGGHIGLELMGRDPRVQSLLICGTPPAKPSLDAMQAAFFPSPAMNFASQRDLGDDECERYARAMVGDRHAESPDILRAIRRTDGNARFWMFKNALDGIGLDARHLVENDPRPLAVVHGADDPFVDGAYLERPSYRNLWGRKVHVLSDVGHAAPWQAPEAFNAILLPFLLSLSSDPPLSRATPNR